MSPQEELAREHDRIVNDETKAKAELLRLEAEKAKLAFRASLGLYPEISGIDARISHREAAEYLDWGVRDLTNLIRKNELRAIQTGDRSWDVYMSDIERIKRRE